MFPTQTIELQQNANGNNEQKKKETDSRVGLGYHFKLLPSNKTVSMPTGTTARTSNKALLPNAKLNEQAHELDILPELKENSLLSVCKLSGVQDTPSYSMLEMEKSPSIGTMTFLFK